jgi:hypothetical protein
VQLDAAVAALGAEDVAGETLGVHPHQHVRLSRDLAVDQRDVLRAVDVVPVADDGELAEVGRNPRLGHPVDQLLGLQPVGDELGHGDEGEPSRSAIAWRSARRAMVPSGFRISQITPAGTSPRDGQVDAGLGLPHPLQHAARPGAERKDVPGGADRTARWRG